MSFTRESFAKHETELRIQLAETQKTGQLTLRSKVLDGTEMTDPFFRDVLDFVRDTSIDDLLFLLIALDREPVFSQFVLHKDADFDEVSDRLYGDYPEELMVLAQYLAFEYLIPNITWYKFF